MAIDVATFVAGYPEFEEVADLRPALIQRCLDDAKHYVSQAAFKNRYQAAVFAKAAHLLAMTPYGEEARLKGSKTESCYSVTFDEMCKAAPLRAIVGGGFPLLPGFPSDDDGSF